MSSSHSEKTFYKVIKTYNFDGLIIEVIVKVDCELEATQTPHNVVEDDESQSETSETDKKESLLEEICDQTSAQEPPQNMICSMCLKIIETDDEIVLENCQDIFCRLCIASSIIQNTNDAMICPSKYSNCDKEISNDEIRIVLGDKNYDLYVLHKLHRKLESLVVKDETDYMSLYEKIILYSHKIIFSRSFLIKLLKGIS